MNPNTLLATHIPAFEQDIRRMDRDTMLEHFGSKTGRVVMTRLFRALIVQAFAHIQDGSEPAISGNIRTFWYRWGKPALSKIPDDDRMKTDPYDIMLHVFADLVAHRKLFTYKDFDFSDENWENRRIGTTKPQVLVFAEKTGWVRFLRKIHEETGVSTLALGGMPSMLTSEYTARHILQVIEGNSLDHLIAIVDFDPAGAVIARAFKKQLAKMGLAASRMTHIIHPEHYKPDEIDLYRYPLSTSPRQKTLNTRWLHASGGIQGELFGLEAESMPLARVRTLVDQALEHRAR